MKCTCCDRLFDPKLEDHGKDEDGNLFCLSCVNKFPIQSGWGLFKTFEYQWHIYPIDENHIEDNQLCSCEPKLTTENEVEIIIHNSFDGREGLELSNEILGL